MKKVIIAIIIMLGITGLLSAKDQLWYGQTNAVVMTNAMNYLNSSSFLPAPGMKDGKLIPNQTTSWCSIVSETEDGWYCIPKIPDKRLDWLGVPETNRVMFIEAFGITILTNPVIKVIEEPAE